MAAGQSVERIVEAGERREKADRQNRARNGIAEAGEPARSRRPGCRRDARRKREEAGRARRRSSVAAAQGQGVAQGIAEAVRQAGPDEARRGVVERKMAGATKPSNTGSAQAATAATAAPSAEPVAARCGAWRWAGVA